MKNNIKRQIQCVVAFTIIFIILILAVFFIVKADSKKVILSSIYNTEDVLKNKNYKSIVDMSIKTSNKKSKDQSSNIKYSYKKSNDKYKLDIKQYVNNTLLSSNINYIEKVNNNYVFYYKLNKEWNKINIDDLNSKLTFNIDYSNLSKYIDGYNYVGKVKIDNKKLSKYSIKLKEYEAYNFIYSSAIMNKNNSNKTTKAYLYIDKKKEIIYKIEFNLDSIKDNNTDFEYDITIENKDIGENFKINIPNE